MLVAGMLAAVGLAVGAQRFAAPARTYSLDDTEQLVRQDVASVMKGRAVDVQVSERSARRFGPGDLCSAADAGAAANATDGFAFTARQGQGYFEYRADTAGNIQRCRVVRPLAP